MDRKQLPYINYWKRKAILNEPIDIPTIEFWINANDSPLEKLLFQKILSSKNVLDFGAGDKKIESRLKTLGFSGNYFSYDSGSEFQYSYNDLSEISQKFDCILLLDVIEHLELSEGLNLCHTLLNFLEVGGELIIQTPNARCIRNPLGSDMTHIHLYNAKDLYAYFRALEYDVMVRRVVLKEHKLSLIHSFYYFLSKFVTTKILGMDFADNVILFVKK